MQAYVHSREFQSLQKDDCRAPKQEDASAGRHPSPDTNTWIWGNDISLTTMPGQIALHVIPYFPISNAAARVTPIAPAFELV